MTDHAGNLAASKDCQPIGTVSFVTGASAPPGETGLERLARLAAICTGGRSALIHLEPGRPGAPPLTVAFNLDETQIGIAAGLVRAMGVCPSLTVIADLAVHPGLPSQRSGDAPGSGFMATLTLPPDDGECLGSLSVFGPEVRSSLTPAQADCLGDIAALVMLDRRTTRSQAQTAALTDRAIRSDRILDLVSEATSCAEALTSLLGELCQYHGAHVGRIWELKEPEDQMVELSRYNSDKLDMMSYYRQPPRAPMTVRNSTTASAIRHNRPDAVIYSAIEKPEEFALMPGAIASGLASQISFPIWVEDHRFGISMMFDSERRDLALVIDDISLLANTIRPALFRKITDERIRHVAQHDSLTQLANRLVMQERLAAAITGAHHDEHGLAFLYVDLDGFKVINDTHGHDMGDQLLAAVASRLLAVVRDGDTVARIGGDEFAIVQPLNGQPHAGTGLASRLVEALAEPFEIGRQYLVVSGSIGVAVYPSGGATASELLQNADSALYLAKKTGRNNYKLFHPSMRLKHQERLSIEQDLREAVDKKSFKLAYQPICDIQSLKVVAFEALLRWEHKKRGNVGPDRFVPMAEANGRILPLGRWAMEAACEAAAKWTDPVVLSVNLSPLQFRQVNLVEQISAALDRTGLPPSRLDVEITEGMLLDDSVVVLRTMKSLRELGVSVTLDDFGIAYASLSYLRRFPFDKIKIDRSFVHALDDGSTLAIVEAILSLTRKLNLTAVAEGVETEWQLGRLRELGCSLVQGYLLGRPVIHDLP